VIFSQEMYFDFEDYEQPIKSRFNPIEYKFYYSAGGGLNITSFTKEAGIYNLPLVVNKV
jgi:hypothetical protein